MKHRVAHHKPSDFSLGQVSEFIAEFGRLGGDPKLLQVLIENKARMASIIALARGEALPKGYVLASLVLGDYFISPEEMAAAYHFSYSADQLEYFTDTLPNDKTLQWLRTNNCMLVPGPDTDSNLFLVRRKNYELFDSDDPWWVYPCQEFTRSDTVKGGQWLMLRKDAVPNSDSKTWQEQLQLLGRRERVPNIAELCYGLAVMCRVRDIKLLQHSCVRTSSVNVDGNPVFAGNFWPGRINIYSNESVESSGLEAREGLGISSMLNK